MPNMNGVEATRRLRKMGYKNMVAGLTGNAMDDDVDEFKKAGAGNLHFHILGVFIIVACYYSRNNCLLLLLYFKHVPPH